MNLLVLMLCERPSGVLGLQNVKGSISKGKQCDLVIFDPEAQTEVGTKDIHNRHPEVCIYKGKTLYGKVKETYLGG
jgi:dihydroorotase-like cyclic amidohydrolase